MENKNVVNKPTSGLSQNQSLMEFAMICLSKWGWFFLSVVIALAIGAYVYLSTMPVYQRTATLLIKETSNRRASGSDLDNVLSGSGLMANTSKLANEIVAFKSPTLMQSVVERLGLNVEVYKSARFHDELLYGSKCPVRINFLDSEIPSGLSFKLTPKEGGTYSLSDVVYSVAGDKVESDKLSVHAMGDTVKLPICRFMVNFSRVKLAEFDSPLCVRVSSVKAATGKFLSSFSAAELDIKNRSDAMSLTLKDISTERAEDVLNMVMAVYNENWIADRNLVSKSSSSFISDRLSSLEQDLNNVDDEISTYKSTNLIPDINAVSSLYMTQTAENYRMIQDLDNQLSVARYIRVMLSNVNSKKQLIPMATSVGNSSISSQINEYNKSLLTRNSLVASSSEENPLVEDLDLSLDAMRDAIAAAIDSQIATLEAQIKNIGQNEKKNSSRIAETPSQAKYLLKVGRQQKVMESLYLFLLQKREENELSQAFAAYNTKLITPPTGSNAPVSPQPGKLFLIALVAGLLLPAAALYLMLLLDTTIHSRKDFESCVVPFLSEVPLFKNDKSKSKKENFLIVVKDGKRDVINEAFRILRTNLEFMLQDNGKVVLFTSFNPGSGKTFTSSNLAVAFSMKHKKVLLIDGDLRHASLSNFATAGKSGLADYLAGKESDWTSLLENNVGGYEGLDVFRVGTIPPNPTELISEPKFAELISECRLRYDYVFIDCPPVDIVADTQIISPLVDRTIFIVRSGLLNKTMLDVLDSMYEEKRFNNMCLVLNGTSVDDPRYAYSYGYKYGYQTKYSYKYGHKSAYKYYHSYYTDEKS